MRACKKRVDKIRGNITEHGWLPTCPKCGETTIGQIDIVPGVAEINQVLPGGAIEWSGNTEIDWNEQIPRNKPAWWRCLGCGEEAPWKRFHPKQ